MKPVSIAPPSLSTITGKQSAAAGLVAERAAAERFDTAALVPTFGLIGASFLTALSATMSARTARLDALARSHAAQAQATTTAAAAYRDADGAVLAGSTAQP